MTEEKKPGRKLIPGSPSLDDKEKAAVKAVKEFEQSEKVIELYTTDPENREIIENYHKLLDERDQKLQVAEAAVRATDATCGPFIRTHATTKWLPAALYDRLGQQKFLAIGGKIGTETVYSITKEQAELALASKVIKEEMLPDVRKISPTYRVPKPKLGGE